MGLRVSGPSFPGSEITVAGHQTPVYKLDGLN